MGFFGWLFGRGKKARVETDLDEEIDSLLTSEELNTSSGEVLSTKENAKSSEVTDTHSDAKTSAKTVAKPNTIVAKTENAGAPIVDGGESSLARSGSIEIYKDAKGKFRFRIKASNACTVAHSQGYTSKASCKNGFESISRADNILVVDTLVDKDYTPTIGKAVFEIYKDKEDKFRFRYRAANLNTTLASQGYTAKANCINGIHSVQKLLANYVIDDLTKK